MNFLVYEQDPFVSADICEALKLAFPEAKVWSVDRLKAVQTYLDQSESPLTMILSLVADEIVEAQDLMASYAAFASFVVIGTSQPSGLSPGLQTRYVQKPFSSRSLISVISDGFVVQRGCQKQMQE